MRIYEVTGYDSGGPTTYYEPTKKAAKARVAEMKAEDDPWDSIEVGAIEVEPTRAGIAKAMQYVIHLTCANEH